MRDQVTDRNRSGTAVRRGLQVVLAILAIFLLLAVFWVRQNLYASKFAPVHLVASEQAVLDAKLSRLDGNRSDLAGNEPEPGKPQSLEPYSEEGASREIPLTERELNALVAANPDVAQRVAIGLSDDLISVKMVVPVDDEVPVLGGKTLRVHMGLVVRYDQDRPYIALKGVSVGGIPLPNAWLGYLKNVNLVEEFGTEDGFWKIFAEGVQTIRVTRGRIRITLKE